MLQRQADLPVSRISVWFHFKLWLVEITLVARGDVLLLYNNA